MQDQDKTKKVLALVGNLIKNIIRLCTTTDLPYRLPPLAIIVERTLATLTLRVCCSVQARSPASESSEKSGGSGGLEQEHDQDGASRLDEQEMIGEEDERNQDETETETEAEERRPFDNMREYAESTMQELLAIYGLAGGELAKSVSRQLPPSFLNPALGQHLQQGESPLLIESIFSFRRFN